MSFPAGPTSTPLWTPEVIVSGVTYATGRWNFYVGLDGTAVIGKVNVGITDAQGFRIQPVKASGADLITCAINLATAVQLFS